jgi:salicylate hydroxylase
MRESTILLECSSLISISYNMHMHIDEVISERARQAYTHKYTRGLPMGLKLSNGYTVGAEDWSYD